MGWGLCMDNIQKYWRLYLAGLLVLGGGGFLVSTSNTVDEMQAQEQVLTDEIQNLKDELARKTITEEDLEPEVEIIEKAGTHALDMGEDMIFAQKKIAEAYRTYEPLSEFEDKDGLSRAEEIYTRLTESTDYINAWFLNNTWAMELDSVGTFVDAEKMPIVFSMYTEDGDLAGVVRATYNSERDLLRDIQIDYTVTGYADEADVGGV